MNLRSVSLATLAATGFLASTNTRAAKLEAPFQQTVALTNGTVRLQNVNGKVHFATWDRNEVEIKAVKHASRQSDLDDIKIEVDPKPGRVAIETKYPKFRWGRGTGSSSVDYTIMVPANVSLDDVVTVNGDIEVEGVKGSVKANTVNGKITLTGLCSDARLESVNGSLSASFDEFAKVERCSAKSVNGAIRVSLPAGANATVSANSLNGSISAPAEVPVQKHLVGSDVKGNVGKGGGTIRAETVNGAIRIQCDGPQKANNKSAAKPQKAEED